MELINYLENNLAVKEKENNKEIIHLKKKYNLILIFIKRNELKQ